MTLNGKIKILYIISSSEFSGAEKLLLDLVCNIDKNFDINVVCLNENKKLQDKFYENNINVKFILKSKGFIYRLFELYKFIRKNNFKIVHTHLFGADVFGGIVAKIAGVNKIISTEHNINFSESYFKHIIKSIVLNMCFDNIIAISDSVYEYVNKKYKINYKKIVKVYNGVNVNNFYKKEILKNNIINIGIIGRLNKQKGHDVLIRALSFLNFDYKVFFIGDGEEKDRLVNLAKELKVDNNIVFLGFVDNVSKILENIDIVVVPSLWEGFGLVVIEAMASGKIVVASRIDGLNDIIKDMKNGILFERGNFVNLANKINFIIKNKEESIKIAENGYSYSKEFDIKKMISEYKKIYLK